MQNHTPRWEHFQHGADVGIRGIGPTREDAFQEAAIALTAVITDPTCIPPEQEITIQCEAPDSEILLMDWLNALIYQMSVNHLLFGSFSVHLEGFRLQGRAWGQTVDIVRHQPAVEVKGATFTALSVSQNPYGEWIAQCVVDV